ncbi:MAG: molybdate ABC transporter substrate-binding protein [Burkholderiales bacterium]
MTPPAAVLHVLSGGAAKAAVGALEHAIFEATGATIDGTFGAVGAMRERLVAGEACDVAILTEALVADLSASGQLVAGSSAPLGRVRTGIAVRGGEPLPAIADRASLAATLRAAKCIHFPDPQRATAGIHFDQVLHALGIHDAVAPYIRTWPNGATAMQHLAQSREPHAVGCTQITEIVDTDGVSLVGALPPPFELATVYAAAVSASAADPERARRLATLLAARASAPARVAAGFEI